MMIKVENLLEVELPEEDNFLKVKETLTRIGIASKHEKKLYQSCHILQKRGKYYIVHFKELFLLDGKKSDLTENDIARRNRIAMLLEDWDLVTIVNPDMICDTENTPFVKIIPHKEKSNWELVPKYTIGTKKGGH